MQKRAPHTYFRLHQRATTKSDADQVSPYHPDDYNLFYYDDQWRMVERRIDRDYESHSLMAPWTDAAFTRDETRQHMFRGQDSSYIDELVCFQKDLNNNANFGNATASGDFRGYAATDRNFSVIATDDAV